MLRIPEAKIGKEIEFEEALREFKNSDKRGYNNCANQVCANCSMNIDCDLCLVHAIGECTDTYKAQINKRKKRLGKSGVHSSGIYVDENGIYHYTHPQGSD